MALMRYVDHVTKVLTLVQTARNEVRSHSAVRRETTTHFHEQFTHSAQLPGGVGMTI